MELKYHVFDIVFVHTPLIWRCLYLLPLHVLAFIFNVSIDEGVTLDWDGLCVIQRTMRADHTSYQGGVHRAHMTDLSLIISAVIHVDGGIAARHSKPQVTLLIHHLLLDLSFSNRLSILGRPIDSMHIGGAWNIVTDSQVIRLLVSSHYMLIVDG